MPKLYLPTSKPPIPIPPMKEITNNQVIVGRNGCRAVHIPNITN